MKKITAYTHIGDYGQAVDNFRFMADNEVKTDEVSLTLEGNYCDMSGRILSKGVTAVSAEDGVVTVEVDPFLYRYDFRICGQIGSAAAKRSGAVDTILIVPPPPMLIPIT